MKQGQLIDISMLSEADLQAGAAIWHGRAEKAADEGCGAAAVQMFGNIVRCYAEEIACRAASVFGGVRAFVVDLAELDDRQLQLTRAVAAVVHEPHENAAEAVFDVVTRERYVQHMKPAEMMDLPTA